MQYPFDILRRYGGTRTSLKAGRKWRDIATPGTVARQAPCLGISWLSHAPSTADVSGLYVQRASKVANIRYVSLSPGNTEPGLRSSPRPTIVAYFNNRHLLMTEAK